MKAIQLVTYGSADKALRLADCPKPLPKETEVLIRVESFGLNFADVMARKGFYRDTPPLPAVLGYEVVGVIEYCGNVVTGFEIGDKVLAFTRFGGYAEFCVADHRAVVKIQEKMDHGIAVALCTQYCTAYYSAMFAAAIKQDEKVLIHAAAGGVGLALVELAKLKKCTIFGTAGSIDKLDFLTHKGVHFPINYSESNFVEKVLELNNGQKIDVVFDPIGGKNFKQGKSLLAAGGRIVSYGASSQLQGSKGLVNSLRVLFGFGFYSPIGLIMNSTGILGVNMLTIADHKPELLQTILQEVLNLYGEGKLDPYVGASFSVDKICDAHKFLESRNSMGKIVVNW